jgi:hypothetical protein
VLSLSKEFEMSWSRVLAALGIISGAGGSIWFSSLSAEEQKRFNEQAESFAWQLFQKSLASLEPHQARVIHSKMRSHFN